MADVLLPGFEPSENDLYDMALAVPLEEKIEKAIGFLQSMGPLLKNYGGELYVCDSGGKDSDCIVRLAEMAGIPWTGHQNVTTMDPPELMQFLRKERRATVWHRPKQALLTRMHSKSCGPPTRLARWCCEEYKESADLRDVLKVIGVRAEESYRRRHLWKLVQHDKKTNGKILCPIVYWTEDDVWEFHRLEKLPYCSLYDEGFKRLGCVGCPLGGPIAQAREFARWPRYEENWKRAFRLFWEQWHGVPLERKRLIRDKGGTVIDSTDVRWFEGFGNWEAMWDWWVSGKANKGKDTGCQMEFLFQ